MWNKRTGQDALLQDPLRYVVAFLVFLNIPHDDFPQPLASSFSQLLSRSVILQPDLDSLLV